MLENASLIAIDSQRMILQISDVLDRARLDAVAAALAEPGLWRDGAETASGQARAVKRNLQADPAAPAARGALSVIERAVLAHELVQSAAQPAAVARLLLSRSEPGMGYGSHVDAPYMDGVRTDLSFTLFLSAPDAYEGGELVLEGLGAEDRVKLPAGALVLYPSTSLHRVETVRAGVRLVAVGWLKSRIRSADSRSTVFELEQALRVLRQTACPVVALDRLQNVRNNLLRLFGE